MSSNQEPLKNLSSRGPCRYGSACRLSQCSRGHPCPGGCGNMVISHTCCTDLCAEYAYQKKLRE